MVTHYRGPNNSPKQKNRSVIFERGTDGPVRGTKGPVTGTGPLVNCTKPFLIAPVPVTVLIVGLRSDL